MSLIAFAAALRAAADVLEAHANTPVEPAKPAKGKAKAATESVQPAATPAPAATAPAAQPAQSPAVPNPPLTAVNKTTQNLAALDRDAAVKILTMFGATTVREENGVKKTVVNTSLLKPEQYQLVIDAMEEKKAAIDAAATQVSLV
jgi:hypothetical protein